MRSVHILVVNGRKVRQPVFVLGAPHSGAELIAGAIKRSAGFHLTMGQSSVRRVVYAFARRPSISQGRGDAVAAVLRDAFAQAWQVSPHACLSCSPACRRAGGVEGVGPCVAERTIARYGDATPNLLYCASVLIDAFPDARLVQVIRDGRDAVAGMLADSEILATFRPSFANVDSEFPHPFFGVETTTDQERWPELSLAGKCALRWRSAVRVSARLRNTLSPEQLTTLRYEEVLARPNDAAGAVSAFVGAAISATGLYDYDARRGVEPGGWRHALSVEQASEVENIAGDELRRVGYGS
ncbi:MAG TPA: sulfotransferase [Streptosporangiaceae bacterium]|nr:sulfotransferase [Streptosporangiaceae bacterium]